MLPEEELEYKCFICEAPMIKIQQKTICTYCGKEELSDYICKNGHYVCQECRLSKPLELVIKTCLVSKEKDPMVLATKIMLHPAIPLHGPEHHYLASAVLVTVAKTNGIDASEKTLQEAVERSRRIPLGACGLRGDCGAAVGAGIALSVLTKANWLSGIERSLAMKTVGATLNELAKLGGPRCCKASVYITLKIGVESLEKFFNVKIPLSKPECIFSSRNRECWRKRCPFFVEPKT
jgi:hypothetical protein